MISNRMLSVPWYVGLVVVVSLLMVLATLLSSTPTNIKDVLEGRADLQCHMHDGIRIIEPEMIDYFHEGTWVFSNGHSSQCQILPKP